MEKKPHPWERLRTLDPEESYRLRQECIAEAVTNTLQEIATQAQKNRPNERKPKGR